jgi:hypothetical protein
MPYSFLDDFEGILHQDISAYNVNYIKSAGVETALIENDQKYHGSFSHRMTKSILGLGSVKRAIPNLASGYYYIAARHDSNTLNYSAHILNDSADTLSNIYILIVQNPAYFGGVRAIAYFSGGSFVDSGLRWDKDTWYILKIYFDCNTSLFSAWIIGGAFLTWTAIAITQPFYQNGANVGYFYMGSNNGGGAGVMHWFDGIAYGSTDLGYPYFPLIAPKYNSTIAFQ